MASECGGIEVFFVEQHQDKYYKYMCVICRLIPFNVYQANCCGKFMCEHCYMKQRRLNGQCPSCRGRMEGYVFHDLSRQQEIHSQKVYCYNKVHGCNYTGELSYLEKEHKSTCTYKLVVCQECGEKVAETMMSTHLSDKCRKRAYKCPYCDKTGVFEEITAKHLDECPECLVNCLNNSRGCLAKLKKKEMEIHRTKCNYELVSCRYQYRGCNIAVTRLQKQRHECMCEFKPPEDLHVHLLNHSTLPRQNVLPLHVCIDKFNSRWENKEIWQQDFFTEQNGYYMCLKVHLNHFRDDYLSCYIHVKSGPHDEALCWPFKGIFEIELLNQKEDQNHHMKEIKFITSHMDTYNRRLVDCQMSECLVGLGEPQYMAQCDLLGQLRPNCQYLQDDKVLLRVSVKSAESYNKFWPCFGGIR